MKICTNVSVSMQFAANENQAVSRLASAWFGGVEDRIERLIEHWIFDRLHHGADHHAVRLANRSSECGGLGFDGLGQRNVHHEMMTILSVCELRRRGCGRSVGVPTCKPHLQALSKTWTIAWLTLWSASYPVSTRHGSV